MTRQTLVSSLAILVFGALGVACKAGGVGDPCIPNLEYSPTDPGAVEKGAQIEDRSFQCETRVCLINHFRGRVSCPFGNPKGGSLYTGDDKECYVPGTNIMVTAAVPPAVPRTQGQRLLLLSLRSRRRGSRSRQVLRVPGRLRLRRRDQLAGFDDHATRRQVLRQVGSEVQQEQRRCGVRSC